MAHESFCEYVTDVPTTFDICDLVRNRHTAAWNLFVLGNKEVKTLTVTSFMPLSFRQHIVDSDQSKRA